MLSNHWKSVGGFILQINRLIIINFPFFETQSKQLTFTGLETMKLWARSDLTMTIISIAIHRIQ
jgi:hypothetical protein